MIRRFVLEYSGSRSSGSVMAHPKRRKLAYSKANHRLPVHAEPRLPIHPRPAILAAKDAATVGIAVLKFLEPE